jgi:hypothetical protein
VGEFEASSVSSQVITSNDYDDDVNN